LRLETATRAAAVAPEDRAAGAAGGGVMAGAAAGWDTVDTAGPDGADDGIGRAAFLEAGGCDWRVFSDDCRERPLEGFSEEFLLM